MRSWVALVALLSANAVSAQQVSPYRFSCPAAGVSTAIPSSSIESAISSPGYISIDSTSSQGSLCILTLQDSSGETPVDLPVARSYDGLDWEITAGFLSNLLPSPVCSSSVCNLVGLPAPSSGEKTYVLTSYSHNGFGSQADSARFLEQATFGPTRETITALEALGTGKYKSWVQNQIENVPMSSHREYFRRRLTPRQEYAYYIAAPGPASACEAESHWRKFALSARDGIRWSQSKNAKYLHFKLVNGRYVWYVEGMARTTTDVLPNYMDDRGNIIEQVQLYPILYMFHYREQEQKNCVGCPLNFIKRGGDESSGWIYNPKVDLTGIVNDSNLVPRTIVDLPPILGSGNAMIPVTQEEFETSAFFSTYNKADDEFYLQDASSVDPSQCANHPDSRTAGWEIPTGLPNHYLNSYHHPETVFPPIFGKVFNEQSGQYEHLLFDPKMKIFDNTVDDPIDDGGGYLEYVTKGRYNCANAPRSFQNEDGCKLSFSEYACEKAVDVEITSPQNPEQEGVVVCGSVGEIKNDYSLATSYSWDVTSQTGDEKQGFNPSIFLPHVFTDTKNTIWGNHALFDEGQLRQRMAWALYQIIPIGTPDTTSEQIEGWLQYYDIFVRNSFGSYKNILKEISFTDVMGNWLSFYNNMSLQYNIDNCDLNIHTLEQCNHIHPDENYAREIMQLFSIGVWQLNMDGTKKLDENGQPLHSYDSSDIMNMARAWTGFTRAYRHRGNADSPKWGPHVDLMNIDAEFRDIYPKADLLGGYIGDRYPLCADLPVKDHLMKRAKYRLLGAKGEEEMQSTGHKTWPENENVRKLVLLDSSPLYEKLCAADGSGSCTWPGKVVLQEHLTYTDTTLDEYKVDTIRFLKIILPNGKLVHYEYIRPACVDQFFLGTNAKKVIRGNIGSDEVHKESLCADPKRDIATELCCDPDWESNTSSQYASRHCIYHAERMSYNFANSNRCAEFGKVQCTARRFGVTSQCNIDINRLYWYSWTASGCMTRAKINFDSGLIGRVDYPEADFAGQRLVSKVVEENTKNFFKVAWDVEPNLPSTAADCDALSNCYSVSDGCVCDTSLSEIAVFGSSTDITSKDDLFPALHVGTFGPDSFEAGVVFPLGDCGIPDVNVYSRSSSDSCSSLSTDAFFGFVDHHGIQRYLKNMKSVVQVLGVDASFRNVPYFIALTEHDTRDMYYETDAVVEHFFHHPSHAPFLSSLIIQRFGISNPSPGFVERVATAYVNGVYDGIGSGEYGDLGAMIAAVLLDNESRSTTLDADPSHGHLREPLIKVTSFIRSMDAVYDSPYTWPKFHRLEIGQSPYGSPSVFSFFLPEYVPPGVIEKAKLVAPESQVLTGTQVTELLNGFFSTVKFGLVSCHDGFGATASLKECPYEEGNTDFAAGYLDYSFPSGASVEEAIDDLALLLTAGRLSSTNKDIIRDTISEEYNTGDKAKATRIAQQLVLSSPEFHSWGGLHDNTGDPRQFKGYTWPPKNDYKSVVLFYMEGGADSWGMVVPKSGCSSKNMYNEYKNARGKLAMSTDKLLDIDATGSGHTCNTWGVHYKLPILKDMYDQGDGMFFLNTGILSEPLTKGVDWVSKSKIRLFAHNHMSREMRALDPHDMNPGTGVGGRMLDMLKKNGFQTSGNTVNGNSILNTGDSYYSNAATTISAKGSKKIDEVSSLSKNEMLNLVKRINGKSNAGNSMLGETWSDRLSRTLFEYETTQSIEEAIQNGDFNMDGYSASTDIGEQLKAAAKFMRSRHLRKVDREVYEVNLGGFDMHGHHDNLNAKFSEANNALANFIDELKSQGTWDNTVILMGSDFGRSIAPNSNGGSDHAWGGHYFMLGGGLKGGKIMGEYPEHLSELSPYWVRRGRMIPTTPWDSVWNGIAEWMGVKGDRDLEFVLPNRVNFDKCSKMFTAHDLFLGEVNEPCIDDLDGDGVPDAQDTCQDTMYWMNVPVDSSGCTGPVTMWPTPKIDPTASPTYSPTVFGDIYEAENADYDSDSKFGNSQAGFSGGGYVNYGPEGSWVEWSDIIGTGGSCIMTFRYSATSNRKSDISINGVVVGSVSFTQVSSSWKDYATEKITLTCPSGNMSLRVTASTSEGGPNLDYVVIAAEGSNPAPGPGPSPSPGPSGVPTAIYEAEDSGNTMSSDGKVSSGNGGGFTGSGYANMGGSGSWVEWPAVNGGTGGSCTLKFRYALQVGSSDPRPCEILVNDVDVGTVNFPGVGADWSVYGDDSIDISCPEGPFKVRMTATSSNGGANIDHLEVIGHASPPPPPTPSTSEPPSLNPSAAPVTPPSDSPSLNPSVTPVTPPSNSPSLNPSAAPVTPLSDSPSLNPSAAPVTPPSDSPSLNPSAASVTDVSDSPSLNPSAASVTDTSDSPSLNPSAASVTDTSDSPSLNPSAAAPVSNPGTGPWFIDPAGVTLNTDNEKPRIEVNHNVASGAGGLEVTLYQYDCITPVPANDAVYIVDSLTNLGDDDVAEYVIEFDKETIGSSDLLVTSDELNFCVVAGLEDAASGEILVYSLSRIKLTFDLSYALFFVDVTGVAPNDYDLGDISLFQMNACVCSVSFTCDANPPLLQENTLVSVCLWPSSPGVMFTDFTMDIEGKTNGYSYSPITVANGAQVLDDYTVLQQQNDMWMVTTMLLPGLFENESSMAVISGGGYLEFITSKDEVLKEEKEYTLVVALEEPEGGNPIDCLLDQIGKVMKTEILSAPIKIVGEKMGNLTVSGNLRKRSDND